MKKLLSIAIVCLIIALPTAVSFAHGSCHGKAADKTYSVCSIENCVKTAVHTHNKKAYAAHYYGDGHEYHEYCQIEDCSVTGYHCHEGVYCFGEAGHNGLGAMKCR